MTQGTQPIQESLWQRSQVVRHGLLWSSMVPTDNQQLRLQFCRLQCWPTPQIPMTFSVYAQKCTCMENCDLCSQQNKIQIVNTHIHYL